jgi:hypothetical protein
MRLGFPFKVVRSNGTEEVLARAMNLLRQGARLTEKSKVPDCDTLISPLAVLVAAGNREHCAPTLQSKISMPGCPQRAIIRHPTVKFWRERLR